MRFHRVFSASIKDMVNRKEFLITFTMSILIFSIAVVLDLFQYIGRDVMYVDPAWSFWGSLGDMGPSGLVHSHFIPWTTEVLVLLIPFFASLSYSGCYFDQSKGGVLKFLVVRAGRKNYFLANLLTTFLGGFFMIFIPLLLTQVVLCIAFPLQSFYTISYSAVTDVTSRNLLFHSLYLNHPYIFNLVYSIIPAFAAGCFAMMSFSVSLLCKKSRLLVLTLPGIVWILAWYIFNNVPASSFNPLFLLIPMPHQVGISLVVLFLVLLFIPIVAILLKLFFIKDEL